MKIGGREDAAGGGIGFLGLLTILFIGLKLTGFVQWSWWWVLAPLWIPFALVTALATAVLLLAAAIYLIRGR